MVKKKEKNINIKKEAGKKTTEKVRSPQLWRPLDIWEDVNRLFSEDPWYSPWWGSWGYRLPKFGRISDDDIKFIPLDVIDDNKEYKIIAEMPGVPKKNIEVKITNDTLSICGNTDTDVKKEEEGYIRRERTYSTLCRNLRFPEDVNPDNAFATLNDGILEIKVPKIKKIKKGRSITIK